MITQEQETRETTPATVLDQVLEASQVLSEFTNPSYVEELITGPLTEATEPHVDLSDVESDLDADQEYYAQVLKLREQIERDEALREAAEDVIATWQDYRLSETLDALAEQLEKYRVPPQFRAVEFRPVEPTLGGSSSK